MYSDHKHTVRATLLALLVILAICLIAHACLADDACVLCHFASPREGNCGCWSAAWRGAQWLGLASRQAGMQWVGTTTHEDPQPLGSRGCGVSFPGTGPMVSLQAAPPVRQGGVNRQRGAESAWPLLVIRPDPSTTTRPLLRRDLH